MTAPEIVTFGCRLNAFESEVIRAVADPTEETVIFNTCAVTAEAERQARQAIRKARRERPGACIVVTGCAAQIDPSRYAAMAEVDRVLGNAEKLLPGSYAPGSRVAVSDIMELRETAGHLLSGPSLDGFGGRARAFVQIQTGCDHRCTFCIIPFGRGPSRSLPLGLVVDQVRSLVESGINEVVLTGVDITDYGKDLPGRPTLGEAVRRLLALVPELRRLRLTSLDPVEIDDALLRAIAEEERLMPHLHLSLQAGDDMILKRMKRRHGRGDAIRVCETLDRLRPGIAFGADLIAGFPTETEEMFRNTLDIVDSCGLSHLHVFPFSERPGTPAARMPQLPKEVRRERAARLRARGAERLRAELDLRVGAEMDILVERGRTGRSEHFAPVAIDRDVPPGAIVRARATTRNGEALQASVLA